MNLQPTEITKKLFVLPRTAEIDSYTLKRDTMAREVLLHAAEIIRGGWSQITFARNCEDNARDCSDADASKFCVLGALHRAQIEKEVPELYRDWAAAHLRSVIDPEVGGSPYDETFKELVLWNDEEGQTAENVIRMIEKTVSLIEERLDWENLSMPEQISSLLEEEKAEGSLVVQTGI